jgi:G3E family GTPase
MNTQAILDAVPKRGMPVTIITGFLGSGKTTLLNNILQNREGLKIAILVNEFGDIDIDSQLLVSRDDSAIQLSNGCICCSINEDLVEAVYSIMSREDQYDYLVIETTGVADPLPIIITFVGSDLRDVTRLDAILTVVDAEQFTTDHFDSDAALNQLAYGDVILLNKVDLATPKQVEDLEKYLKNLKVGVRTIRTERCQVPLPLILDIDTFQIPAAAEREIAGSAEDSHHHHHDEECNHHSHHLENDGFVSYSFESDRPFSIEKFQGFLDKLPTQIFRAKGIIWFAESELRHIFQLSGQRYDIKNDRWPNSPRVQLVFIGRNIDFTALQLNLEKCIATT